MQQVIFKKLNHLLLEQKWKDPFQEIMTTLIDQMWLFQNSSIIQIFKTRRYYRLLRIFLVFGISYRQLLIYYIRVTHSLSSLL